MALQEFKRAGGEELGANSELCPNFRPLGVVTDPVALLVVSEGSGGVYQNLFGGFNVIGTGSHKQVSRLELHIGCSAHDLDVMASFDGVYGMS